MDHFILIGTIIAVIVFIQFCVFINTLGKIKVFKNVFPKTPNYNLKREVVVDGIMEANNKALEKMLMNAGIDNADKYYTVIGVDSITTTPKYAFNADEARKDLIGMVKEKGIFSSNHNPVYEAIEKSINDYLNNNKTGNDFHLMKDIVDRNCDIKEDEISTQIPIPLYMGLVGTMAGILVGILYLWLSGGISALLKSSSEIGADGIEALLGGVALAMISSICGIILTTIGSNKLKKAKAEHEANKHTFLNWIQVNLLPTLSDNVATVLQEMTANLNGFNETFSLNVKKLDGALANVRESTVLQKQLLDSVAKIADKNITEKNIRLFSALENSTRYVGEFSEYMASCTQYLNNVKQLNEKIGDVEARTQSVERMGAFFDEELHQIEARKSAISLSVGKVDDYLKQALEKLRENSDKEFQAYQKFAVKQQEIIEKRSDELVNVVNELKQMTAVKETMSKLERAMRSQNDRLSELSQDIRDLAAVKTSGNTQVDTMARKLTPKQLWRKTAIIAGITIVGMFLLAVVVVNWDGIFDFLSSILAF